MLAEMHMHVTMYMNNTILLNSHVIIMFTRVTDYTLFVIIT